MNEISLLTANSNERLFSLMLGNNPPKPPIVPLNQYDDDDDDD